MTGTKELLSICQRVVLLLSVYMSKNNWVITFILKFEIYTVAFFKKLLSGGGVSEGSQEPKNRTKKDETANCRNVKN